MRNYAVTLPRKGEPRQYIFFDGTALPENGIRYPTRGADRIEGERQELERRNLHRTATERVSIAACSRILKAIERGVDGLANDDAWRLARSCQRFVVDPSTSLANAIISYCLEHTQLIQCLEPPIDAWSSHG